MQVVWFGLPCVLVLCHATALQVLSLEACKRLVALQLLSAQPVGYLPLKLGEPCIATDRYTAQPDSQKIQAAVFDKFGDAIASTQACHTDPV